MKLLIQIDWQEFHAAGSFPILQWHCVKAGSGQTQQLKPHEEEFMPLPKYSLDRRSPRVSKPMAITVWDAENDSATGLAGAILDLSDHGLRVATKAPLRQGQTVLVMLNKTSLCFRRCRVVWSRPQETSEFSQEGLEVLR